MKGGERVACVRFYYVFTYIPKGEIVGITINNVNKCFIVDAKEVVDWRVQRNKCCRLQIVSIPYSQHNTQVILQHYQIEMTIPILEVPLYFIISG